MSHQDSHVRAMMRAQKALKSAFTHLERVPNNVCDPFIKVAVGQCTILLKAETTKAIGGSDAV